MYLPSFPPPPVTTVHRVHQKGVQLNLWWRTPPIAGHYVLVPATYKLYVFNVPKRTPLSVPVAYNTAFFLPPKVDTSFWGTLSNGPSHIQTRIFFLPPKVDTSFWGTLSNGHGHIQTRIFLFFFFLPPKADTSLGGQWWSQPHTNSLFLTSLSRHLSQGRFFLVPLVLVSVRFHIIFKTLSKGSVCSCECGRQKTIT